MRPRRLRGNVSARVSRWCRRGLRSMSLPLPEVRASSLSAATAAAPPLWGKKNLFALPPSPSSVLRARRPSFSVPGLLPPPAAAVERPCRLFSRRPTPLAWSRLPPPTVPSLSVPLRLAAEDVEVVVVSPRLLRSRDSARVRRRVPRACAVASPGALRRECGPVSRRARRVSLGCTDGGPLPGAGPRFLPLVSPARGPDRGGCVGVVCWGGRGSSPSRRLLPSPPPGVTPPSLRTRVCDSFLAPPVPTGTRRREERTVGERRRWMGSVGRRRFVRLGWLS